MSQGVTVIETQIDHFNGNTGEIISSSRKHVRKNKTEPTDEFIKVSKYLNTIFAYNSIPLSLVPISLILAQMMEFKTNKVYLLKANKEEIAEMLCISLDRVNKLIAECRKYDIIRPIARATYEVNSYLYSTGNILETRELQAHFDFENDTVIAQATQVNKITGNVVRRAVINKKDQQIPGQMSLADLKGVNE